MKFVHISIKFHLKSILFFISPALSLYNPFIIYFNIHMFYLYFKIKIILIYLLSILISEIYSSIFIAIRQFVFLIFLYIYFSYVSFIISIFNLIFVITFCFLLF